MTHTEYAEVISAIEVYTDNSREGGWAAGIAAAARWHDAEAARIEALWPGGNQQDALEHKRFAKMMCALVAPWHEPAAHQDDLGDVELQWVRNGGLGQRGIALAAEIVRLRAVVADADTAKRQQVQSK